MTAEIPLDKVTRTVTAIDEAMAAHWIPATLLMSLVGLIGFCGQILVSGRWRTPWTITALRAALATGFAPMNSMWLDELGWWKNLLTDWNRVAMLVKPDLLIPLHAADMVPFTDASGGSKGGAGAVFGKYWQAFLFTREETSILPICDLEGLVSVLWITEVCERWPEQIAGKRFMAWNDNTTFVGAVNDHKSNSPCLAFLLGILHDLMARFSFDLRLKWVKSAENVAADAASREDWERFYEFMQSVGIKRADMVRIPLQASRRNSLTSKMMSMRLLKTAVQPELSPLE